MARKFQKNAKRSDRPNPRQERNNFRFPNFNMNDDAVEQDGGINGPRKSKKKVVLLPRGLNQETYVEALMDPDNFYVFAMGPAGCGKTLLATEFAISELQTGNVDKIIITRPAVSTDEEHGFLPGGIFEKMAPWMMPILDVFKEYYSPGQVEKMIRDEVIEIAPLAYMRGRTFKNAIVLADEMQNSKVSQMKMVLTRLGEGSRMIVTGDLKQHDGGFETNGLKDFVARLRLAKSNQNIAVCEFTPKDVQRHPGIEAILSLYGED